MQRLLEELIASYPGTVLLVSHDRAFLDNVVTSTLAFEGSGKVTEYVGGWADYLRQTKPQRAARSDSAVISQSSRGPTPARSSLAHSRSAAAAGARANADADQRRLKKLSFKEKRDLEALPAKLAALEAEQQRLKHESESVEFYKEAADHIRGVLARIAEVEKELDAALARWMELEERSGQP